MPTILPIPISFLYTHTLMCYTHSLKIMYIISKVYTQYLPTCNLIKSNIIHVKCVIMLANPITESFNYPQNIQFNVVAVIHKYPSRIHLIPSLANCYMYVRVAYTT